MKSQIINTLNVLLINSSKILKKIARKSIVAIGILLLILLLKIININQANILLNSVKETINYEFSIVDDSKRIFNKAKDLLDNSQKVLQVFNLGVKDKYPTPISGSIHKGYHEETNKGWDIKSNGDHEPIAILDGVVKEVILMDNKGYYVTVETGEFQYTYGYLSKAYVTIGDTVAQGDFIGYLGTNKDGYKYLRFEVIKDGKYINPENYIELE
ncbi:MAG: M23 family metallopeptidase [Tissierella sp.]|nr:M23 family metallopeptidase [Tissierella sp.]